MSMYQNASNQAVPGVSAGQTVISPNHPIAIMQSIRAKLATDKRNKSDPVATFAAIRPAIDQLKAGLAPARGLDPLLSELIEGLQEAWGLVESLAADITQARSPSHVEPVSPAPEPAPVAEPASVPGDGSPTVNPPVS